MTIGLALVVAAAAPVQRASAAETTREIFPGIAAERVSVLADDGARLQAYVTKPRGRNGKLPAILFVQWLSCGSVELPADAADKDGWSVMLERLVTDSNVLVWRTDKRGVGDSDGQCDRLDYNTEVDDHLAALRQLKQRPDVDPDRIVIFGASMGSNIAPLLAVREPVAAVAVWGGGARTWAERTIAFERNRIDLGETAVRSRSAAIGRRLRLIHAFLVDRLTPAEIALRDPELRDEWSKLGGGPKADTLYGRPFSFHWQAQDSDWAGAWARISVPVLAMFGEHDWFEDPDGARLIGEIINRQHPGRATVAIVPRLNHHFSSFADRRSAFRDETGRVDPAPALDVLLPWLKRIQR